MLFYERTADTLESRKTLVQPHAQFVASSFSSLSGESVDSVSAEFELFSRVGDSNFAGGESIGSTGCSCARLTLCFFDLSLAP